MDILDDMGVSKLSAKVFFNVNYCFNEPCVKSKYNPLYSLKLSTVCKCQFI